MDTGEDDVVKCPYCHRMRDRKAIYCRWCNDSAWEPSAQDEFEEIDKILKDIGSSSTEIDVKEFFMGTFGYYLI